MGMVRNFEDAVIGILGPARSGSLREVDWGLLKRRLGVSLPCDYKRIIVRYAPVQVNVHMFLHHPSTERWNLGQWMEGTVAAFSSRDLTGAQCPGFPGGPVFGGAGGLTPLLSTDRGEYLFGAVKHPSEEWRFLACNGDEQDFYEYRVSFAEWLYRYLSGESMFGPGSAVFYPGPVEFEGMPMTATEPFDTWYGPDRGDRS
jgi:hypothetical protein